MGVSFQCPQDVVQLLMNKLGPHFEAKGIQFRAHYVQRVRSVKNMLPREVSLYGAYKTRGGMEAPHSHVFTAHGWLHPHLQRRVHRDGAHSSSIPHSADVVALVKQWMKDEELSQDPLLVYPHALRNIAVRFVQRLATNSETDIPFIKDDRRAEVQKISDFLASRYTIYGRAVQYLRELAAPPESAVEPPPLPPLGFATQRLVVEYIPEICTPGSVPSELVPHRLCVRYAR
jgi:hypothetical protein